MSTLRKNLSVLFLIFGCVSVVSTCREIAYACTSGGCNTSCAVISMFCATDAGTKWSGSVATSSTCTNKGVGGHGVTPVVLMWTTYDTCTDGACVEETATTEAGSMGTTVTGNGTSTGTGTPTACQSGT